MSEIKREKEEIKQEPESKSEPEQEQVEPAKPVVLEHNIESEMIESFVEPKGKSGKWSEIVENKNLGVSYREKVIELPESRKQEVGIDRIRRREILELPIKYSPEAVKKFYEKEKEKAHEVFRFITDGRFPAYQTWSHEFLGDYGEAMREYGVGRYRFVVNKFKKEGLYFQTIQPPPMELSLGTCTYFEEKELAFSKTEEKTEKFLFDFSVMSGKLYGDVWTKGYPIFVFGAKNRTFVSYIHSIISNPKSIEMLQKSGWEIGNPLEIIKPNSEEYIIEFERYFNPEYRKKIIKELQDQNVSIARGGDAGHNLETLKLFTQNKLFDPSPVNHPYIPIISHPEIKPMRWCHAELAIVPTEKSLNVLFFETEEKEKKKISRFLFINDDNVLLGSLRRAFLGNPNMAFVECHNVEEALGAIAEQQPDVLFLDHHLTDNGNEGFKIADQLKGIKIYSTTTDSSVLEEYQKRGIENVGKMDLKKIKSIIAEYTKEHQESQESKEK